jgi:hypothetical protein
VARLAPTEQGLAPWCGVLHFVHRITPDTDWHQHPKWVVIGLRLRAAKFLQVQCLSG